MKVRDVAFPGTTTVAPAFGLGKLPDGLRMCTFDVEKGGPGGPRTSYSVGTCSALPPVQVRSDESGQVRGTAGQPVQGHATRCLDENGYRTLWILKAVHDAPIAVAGPSAQAELYAIADHLVLPIEVPRVLFGRYRGRPPAGGPLADATPRRGATACSRFPGDGPAVGDGVADRFGALVRRAALGVSLCGCQAAAGAGVGSGWR
jgi:hypothetical protein